MCELPIESKKYGTFVVLYDECDEEVVNKYIWSIVKGNSTFYVETSIYLGKGRQKILKMHRLLTNASPGTSVDHINHIGWDNRQSNLRLCSNKENHQNQLKTKTNTSSQYKGVCWHKAANKWRADIQIEGKLKYLGLFTDEVIAAKAYDIQAKIHFKEFAVLNFPRPIAPTIIINNITINNNNEGNRNVQ